MGTIAKGLTIIDAQLYNWSEDDREDALEFAKNPINGITAITLYLQQKGIKASTGSVHRWLKQIRIESDRVVKMKAIFDDFRGVTPDEVNMYCAATMAFVMVSVQEDLEKTKSLDPRKIQILCNLAKEARSSALAMNTPHTTASMQELELGHALFYASRLEAIFEGDDIILERVKNANKSILSEIESSYSN